MRIRARCARLRGVAPELAHTMSESDTPLTILSDIEARVLGCLIEKESTTPEQYPLTENAVTVACNQKTSRDPVMDLSPGEVGHALRQLEQRRLVRSVHGSRAQRYEHRFAEHYGVTAAQQAVLALLLLRGPQTKGELRTRAGRMHAFDDVAALSDALAPLLEKGFLRRLDPAPGSRAERYEQLLAPGLHGERESPAAPRSPADPGRGVGLPPANEPFEGGLGARVEALENDLATLRRQLASLAEKLGEALDG